MSMNALGTKASFDKTTAAALKAFHDKWYAPNNAILVVVGDVDPAAVLAKVRTDFGPIPAKTIPQKPTLSLSGMAGGHIILPTDRPSTTQLLVFRMPGMDSADFPALELLTDAWRASDLPFTTWSPRAKRSARNSPLTLCQRPASATRRSLSMGMPPRRKSKIKCAAYCAMCTITVSRLIWWSRPNCRSIAKRSFRKTPSPDWRLFGPTPWRFMASPSPDADLARLDKVTRRRR